MSPSTLLSLLSDQRMQNVIPLLQRGLHFDRLVLLASQEDGRISPRFARIAQDLYGALRSLAAVELHPDPVDPMSPEAARLACLEIIRRWGGPEQVTVNFTGGTKPMSIGAYQAGQECGAELLYVDTQAEQIFRYTSGILQAIPFDLEPIGVEMVLDAHGVKVEQNPTAGKALSQAEMYLVELIYDRRPESLLALHPFRQWMFKTMKELELERRTGELVMPHEAWAAFPDLLDAFAEVGFASESEKGICLAPAAEDFIDGRWLEGYVYLALEKSGAFMDVKSQIVVSGVENELDVTCTLNAKLGVIECKCGSLKGRDGQAALNRLQALRDILGGVFAKSFLVIPYPVSELTEQFIKRAKEYKSCLVDQKDLPRVEEVIRDEMLKKRR